jgi:signal transduction histidine kinase
MPVTITTIGASETLSPGLQLCAYRIVQEALTNALKHAGGATTRVVLDYRPNALALRVHNEVGNVTPAAVPDGGGHGLVGMRERVRLYGGMLTAAVQPDGSYLVDAVLSTGS